MKHRIAFALIMGIITTGIISFILITVNVGFNARFLSIWLRSWSMAYIVVVPAILIIGPRVQKLVDHLFRNKTETRTESDTKIRTETKHDIKIENKAKMYEYN